jgi:hypothetical protein
MTFFQVTAIAICESLHSTCHKDHYTLKKIIRIGFVTLYNFWFEARDTGRNAAYTLPFSQPRRKKFTAESSGERGGQLISL